MCKLSVNSDNFFEKTAILTKKCKKIQTFYYSIKILLAFKDEV